ncbi:hypothetical protein C2S51_017381 [Perilla frutescens var. frutescens]|nr:hypothetical protein C2S51_017381 [Perilla frutescens var. frutescens]
MSMNSSSENKRKSISTITGSRKKKKTTAENQKIRCVICRRKVEAGGAEGTSVVFPLCSLCKSSYLMNNFPLPNYLTSIPNFQLPPYYSQPQIQEPLHFSDDDELVLVPVPIVCSKENTRNTSLISLYPERDAVAAAESTSPFVVVIGLKAPPLISQSQRAPLDMVTVLDVSSSMNETGCQDARCAVDLLCASGGTNIVEGLTKGAWVLEERRFKNPVATIIFLYDGNDTYNLRGSLLGRNAPEYLHFLPPSIFPRNQSSQLVVPVHSFSFGSDHDPITMHVISEASGGAFSFIESYEMVQDAFASCIGGLMSVVTHELHFKVRSASHGVEIKSIPSGRYRSEEVVEIEQVEIKWPNAPSLKDVEVKIEVNRQRNRLCVAESIQKAQEMAEAGNLREAKNMLVKKRDDLMGSAAGKAGDSLVVWLEDEFKQTEMRMESAGMYERSGRAFALAGMSSHASQRATTRGGRVAGIEGYATPHMANMVTKSRQQVIKKEREVEANNMMVIASYRQPKKEQITPKNEYYT